MRVVAHLDGKGQVTDAFVLQSRAVHDLNIAALAAVIEWHFLPGKKAGRNVAGDVMIPIRFRDEVPR